jgi:hypothetical protein
VKNYTKVILGCIFTILITCSIQSADADFVDERYSKYKMYLHTEVRNAQGQLISISDGSIGTLLTSEITDRTFNEKLGKIEIVTIDNVKYEKVQYADLHPYWIYEEKLGMSINKNLEERYNSGTSHFIGLWKIIVCGEAVSGDVSCLPVFHVNTAHVLITEGDSVTLHWTILRIIN